MHTTFLKQASAVFVMQAPSTCGLLAKYRIAGDLSAELDPFAVHTLVPCIAKLRGTLAVHRISAWGRGTFSDVSPIVRSI